MAEAGAPLYMKRKRIKVFFFANTFFSFRAHHHPSSTKLLLLCFARFAVCFVCVLFPVPLFPVPDPRAMQLPDGREAHIVS